MPIWMRKFYLGKLQEAKEREKTQTKNNTSPATMAKGPDIKKP